MHTLVDFMTRTEGLAMLTGGLLLAGFIPFWLFLTEREK